MNIEDLILYESLVGVSVPSFTVFPESTCVIIVGITALADCLGPYWLNGLMVATGTSKDL